MSNPKLALNAHVARAAGEFVVGPENRLAATAIASCLDALVARDVILAYAPDELCAANGSSGERPTRHDDAAAECAVYARTQLLVLYGAPCTGKTLLAQSFADTWRRRRPLDQVTFVTGADFARDLADSIESRSSGAWRAQHRDAALFVLDELHCLAAKPAAQFELAATLDALAERMSQAIITSRSAPHDMPQLVPALRSRLAAGLSINVEPTGPEARRKILERLAAARGMRLAAAACNLLAQQLDVTAAELLGALMHLEATVGTRAISADDAAAYVRSLARAPAPGMRAIARETARHYALRVAELKGPSRRRAVALARGVAMYLMRQLTDKSLEQIGRHFGGRDHTTVLHACRKLEALVERDAEVRRSIQQLRERLAG